MACTSGPKFEKKYEAVPPPFFLQIIYYQIDQMHILNKTYN